jgi:exonuclease SbcC
VCQGATETVQRCEAEKESAKWANPINQLRQRLQPGEPCSVCGAIDHPCADVVETEDEELLHKADNALAEAEVDADKAYKRLQTLQTRQIQTEQNSRNTAEQIEACEAEIAVLRDNEKAQFLAAWQEIYPDIEVSSDWIAEQITEADTAIADIVEAEQTHTQALHAYETGAQLLESCESSIESESQSLNEAKDQLQEVSNNVEDLKVAVADIETSLWDLMPKTFQESTPKEAKELFENKIKEVEAREKELNGVQTQLQVLETNIAATQSNLEDLKDRCETLQAEVDEYQGEGETLLETVRHRTDGLETEDEISAAMDTLGTELKAKENARDETQQQLQKSKELFTQKLTTHELHKKQQAEFSEKLETARVAYFDKLENAGFGSPEAHDNAFRDDDQIQELTDQIDAHEDEKQQLALEITELHTRFEETPFDPEALGQIEAQAEEIGAQLQARQQEIGAQQQRIDNLKDALEKREALGAEISEAEQELMRWKRLQKVIRANDLRDFALEIMFRQMGNLANEQLKYLTSERYQLKVESIGDLTVIDRWNANEERPVETLSGGESFLTSLALALALADLSRGRAQLNSLFLDEGFGTLDTETLDVAIAALEGLRMQGRSIFLISHIQELTRRLPVKINVRKQGNGSSSIDIRG